MNVPGLSWDPLPSLLGVRSRPSWAAEEGQSAIQAVSA